MDTCKSFIFISISPLCYMERKQEEKINWDKGTGVQLFSSN
ncbi:hypothetical protein V1503_20570 [Bacillus sp. SCS-151]